MTTKKCNHNPLETGDKCPTCGEVMECLHEEWDGGHCLECGIYMGEVFEPDAWKDAMEDRGWDQADNEREGK